MAVYNAFVIPAIDIKFASKQGTNYSGFAAASAPSVLTYQYKILSTGAEGSTTSAASIPAGSVVIGTYYS